MAQRVESTLRSAGFFWLDCPYPVVALGLERILEAEARVYVGREPPEDTPSLVILSYSNVEGILEGVKRIRKQSPTALIIVFGLHVDLEAARTSLRAGAGGYIHAGMTPEQIIRAVRVASEGEVVAPRQLLEYLVSNEEVADLGILSARQREVLALVVEGMSNAQIASRLSISESTVKQHLRAAYKLLGVRNRTEAARLARLAAPEDGERGA
jgi:DNA-binding NarL/FixJ family response regulator